MLGPITFPDGTNFLSSHQNINTLFKKLNEELNILRPSNFIEKYFMAQTINFTFLIKTCLC